MFKVFNAAGKEMPGRYRFDAGFGYVRTDVNTGSFISLDELYYWGWSARPV